MTARRTGPTAAPARRGRPGRATGAAERARSQRRAPHRQEAQDEAQQQRRAPTRPEPAHTSCCGVQVTATVKLAPPSALQVGRGDVPAVGEPVDELGLPEVDRVRTRPAPRDRAWPRPASPCSRSGRGRARTAGSRPSPWRRAVDVRRGLRHGRRPAPGWVAGERRRPGRGRGRPPAPRRRRPPSRGRAGRGSIPCTSSARWRTVGCGRSPSAPRGCPPPARCPWRRARTAPPGPRRRRAHWRRADDRRRRSAGRRSSAGW